jgi:hypothetical protein
VSNLTYFKWTSSPVTSEDDLPGYVLEASYSIPLFWYALFDEKSIVEIKSGDSSYQALCKPTKEAILLTCERWQRIRGLFEDDFEPRFRAWVNFLEKEAGRT